MIEIDELTVMQNDLRHTSQIEKMIQYVKDGGFWTQEALREFATQNKLARVCPVIEIVKFPDSRLMIHDGHHRAVATYLGGRDYLRSDEFALKLWTYEDYLDISFKNRWVTPFDPRLEIRVADFLDFKKKALELAATDEEEAKRYILANRSVYTLPRTVSGVTCLASRYIGNNIDIHKEYNDVEVEYFRAGT